MKQKAWNPIIGTIEVTKKLQIIKIIDWTAGTGKKPKAGVYVGRLGIVTNKKHAVRFPIDPKFKQTEEYFNNLMKNNTL